MKKISTKKIVLTGLMIAVVFITTFTTKIPAGIGYFNLGDAAIMLTAVLLGRNSGLAAGALGSALSDFLGPWSFYTPITFIVKGLEGYIIGVIAHSADNSRKGNILRIVGVSAGAAVMVVGYFIGDLYGLKFVGQNFGLATAVSDLTPNLIQGAASIILGLILTTATSKANINRLID